MKRTAAVLLLALRFLLDIPGSLCFWSAESFRGLSAMVYPSARVTQPAVDIATKARRVPRMAFASASGGGDEEGELGDKKGFTVLRVLSEGAQPKGGQKSLPGAENGKKKTKPRVIRLDEALMELDPRRYPTPSAAKKEIRKGSILVNGVRGKIDQNVYIGSERITVQGRTSSSFQAYGKAPFHIRVIYQDDFIAVVHKPPGVCTHPPPHSGQDGSDRQSMSVCVPYFVTPAPPGTEKMLWRPTVVHRLDKLTEGVQLVAKTKKAAVHLQEQFTNRKVKKRYIAVIEGSPEGDSGTINLPIATREAQSAWRVMYRTRSPAVPSSHITTLELSPLQGRTHQLRIHCADGLDCPIVGDPKYGGRRGMGYGMLLAAESITFDHPETGGQVSFSMGEPERFVKMREQEHRAFELGEAGGGGGEAEAVDEEEDVLPSEEIEASLGGEG